MPYMETERLILRDWQANDLPLLIEMNADPEVMHYFPNTLSAEDTWKFYARLRNEFEVSGYGLYALETKSDARFIGFIGFHQADFGADFTPCIEIAWRLTRAAWGKGYATEGATACLAYGHRVLHFDTVYAFTAAINRRSERVMQKIGLEKIGIFHHPNVHPEHRLCEHVLYRSTR